jgi:hypothetical protein
MLRPASSWQLFEAGVDGIVSRDHDDGRAAGVAACRPTIFKETNMKYCIVILLALASVNSYAGLTKWVDANGVVHYSDGPPPENVQSQQVHIRSTLGDETTPASGPKAAKTIFEREAELNKERKAQKEAEKKAAEKEKQAKIKEQNCAQARSQLDTLKNAPRIATYDAQGNPSYMDDTTRNQQISQAESAVSQFCN